MTVHLTRDEIARYRPYHTMVKFWEGFRDYRAGRRVEHPGVFGQAYDRGAECAMRRTRGFRPAWEEESEEGNAGRGGASAWLSELQARGCK